MAADVGKFRATRSAAITERHEDAGLAQQSKWTDFQVRIESTFSPAGEVTECHVVSSELHDPDLEKKIVARVKLFRFAAKDVATITTTKPIEFVPTA